MPIAIPAVIVALALLTAVLYLTRGTGTGPGTGSATGGQAVPAADNCTAPAQVIAPSCPEPGRPAVITASAAPTPGQPVPQAGYHARGARPPGTQDAHPAASTSPSAAQSPQPPAPSTSATPPPSNDQAAAQVLALMNTTRAQAGLAPYTVSTGLQHSASAHTEVMAKGCGLSHQCPGEASLGARESAAGVHWTSAGENIGEEGPLPDSAAAIARAAVGLTQDMLNEKPPDDGHRLNILSSAFHHAGIDVYLDSSGTLWMTQDFSN